MVQFNLYCCSSFNVSQSCSTDVIAINDADMASALIIDCMQQVGITEAILLGILRDGCGVEFVHILEVFPSYKILVDILELPWS